MKSAIVLGLVSAIISVPVFANEEKSLHEIGKHTDGYCTKQSFAIVKGRQVVAAKVTRAEDRDFASRAENRAKAIYRKYFNVDQSAKLNVVESKLSFGKEEGGTLEKLLGVTIELEQDGSDEMYLVLQFTPSVNSAKPALLLGIHEHQGSEAYWVCEDTWE